MNNHNPSNSNNHIKRLDPFHLAMIAIITILLVYWLIGSVQYRLDNYQTVILQQQKEIYTLNKRILLLEEYSDYAKKFNEFMNNTDYVVKKLHQTSVRTNKVSKNNYSSNNISTKSNYKGILTGSDSESESEIMIGSEYDIYGNAIEDNDLDSKVNRIKNKLNNNK